MQLIPVLLFSIFFSFQAKAASLETVDHVDLTRYVGKWYEIAAIPQSFQKQCIGNVTANYSAISGSRVSVTNGCDTDEGKRSVSKGQAKVTDKDTNAKLKVTFVKFFGKWIYAFGGDYWVIDLDPNYRYAVVGHPDRTYGWILARDPRLSDYDLIRISQGLLRNGYDLKDFYITKQSGGLQKKMTLANYLKTIRAD